MSLRNVLNLAEEMHSRMEKSRKTDKKGKWYKSLAFNQIIIELGVSLLIDGARGNANIGSKSIESTSPCATIQSAQWAPRGELVSAKNLKQGLTRTGNASKRQMPLRQNI